MTHPLRLNDPERQCRPQGYRDDVVLRPRGAGVPGDVPVRRLWGEHHLPARARAGLQMSSDAQGAGTMITGAMVTGAMVAGTMVTGPMGAGTMVMGPMVTGPMVPATMVPCYHATGYHVKGYHGNKFQGFLLPLQPAPWLHLTGKQTGSILFLQGCFDILKKVS